MPDNHVSLRTTITTQSASRGQSLLNATARDVPGMGLGAYFYIYKSVNFID